MRRLLGSRRGRIFLVAWVLYSAHFATNIVREHYPAFSLVDHGTFRVDEYQGFHSDIFVHRDGHSVIGNQVFVSMLAAIPLWVFDPVLDALQRYSLARLQAEGVEDAEYRTDKPNRRAFFRLVKERGLDLRFGAAAAITVIFFMAPITAAFLVLFYGVLRDRGVGPRDATALALLLGLGTPLWFRTTNLNHNLFVMYAMFIAFVLLWVQPDGREPVPFRRRLAAGFFGGITLATDYIGVIVLPLLYAYLVLPRLRTASWRTSIVESIPMIVGSLPPIAFLWYSQWAMYGHPFYPGQHWMPDQNVYVHEGMRGFTLPDPELFLQNLFHPGFGLFVWAPILALAFVPARGYPTASLILPRRERWFVAASVLVFMIFCSMNQYARLQWNSGFRYLVPLVPFLVLALSDHWVRLPRLAQVLLVAGAVLHSWVLTVFREPALQSWKLFFEEGIQLPWYRVLGMTAPPGTPFVNRGWVPAAILGLTIAVCVGLWRYGARLATRQRSQAA